MLPPKLVRAIAVVILIVWPVNLIVDYVWDKGEPLVNVIMGGMAGSLFILKKKDDDDGDS